MATKRQPLTVAALGGVLILGGAGTWSLVDKWESGGQQHFTVYADKLAGGLPTVCSGITRHVTTTPIIVGERWTAEKCAEEEQAAMLKVQRHLLTCFKMRPPQSVFDAASSHAWNNGAANTCNSVAMHFWNEGDWRTGCQRMAHSANGKPVWSSVRTGRILPNGKPEFRFVQGLYNRRIDEAKACMKNVP